MPEKNSPFRWPGSKDVEAKSIVMEFPEHRVYVEPFGGSGAVLFLKDRSQMEVFNDINGDLVHFMEILRDRPKELTAWLDKVPFSRELYEDFATEWYRENNRPSNDIVRAGQWFYLRYTNFGGKAGRKAGFGQSRNRNYAGNYASARSELEAFSDRISGVIIENSDWEKVVELYDAEDTVFYCDPPYEGTGYVYETGEKWTMDELEPLNDIQGDWIVSAGEVAADVLDAEYETTEDTKRGLSAGKTGSAKDTVERLYYSYDPRSESTFNPEMNDALTW